MKYAPAAVKRSPVSRVKCAIMIAVVISALNLPEENRHRLDRLYQRPAADLDALLEAIGLRTAA